VEAKSGAGSRFVCPTNGGYTVGFAADFFEVFTQLPNRTHNGKLATFSIVLQPQNDNEPRKDSP
jgi:hypothetical protein